MLPDTLPPEGGTIYGRRAKPDYKIDESGCWVWQKARSVHGYPEHGRGMKPHRAYLTIARGPFPKHFHVHHKCETRACINPDHLEAIDPAEHRKHHWLDKRDLTLDTIKEIRELGKTRARYQDVAKQYGVSPSVVIYYWCGWSWGNATGDKTRVYPEPWPCAAPDCDELVVGKRRHKQYCTARCRGRTNDRKRRADATFDKPQAGENT